MSCVPFQGAQTFGIQLTKGTLEESVIGPLSIKELQNDRYVYCTTGSLVEADFFFCDEIFNANDQLLNSLNSILQERELRKGTQTQPTRLRSTIATSN